MGFFNFAKLFGGSGGRLPLRTDDLMKTPSFAPEGAKTGMSAARPSLPASPGKIDTPVMTPPDTSRLGSARRWEPDALGMEMPEAQLRPELTRPAIVQKAMSDPTNLPREAALNRPNPTGFKQKAGEFLKNFGAGAVLGADSGDPWSMLGAGLAGGIGGTVNPTAGRRMRFENFEQPRILQQEGIEQNRQKAILDNLYREAQTRNQQAQEEWNRARAESENQPYAAGRDGMIYNKRTGQVTQPPIPRPQRPMTVAPGGTAIDPVTGKAIFTAPERRNPLEDLQRKNIESQIEARKRGVTLDEQRLSDSREDRLYRRNESAQAKMPKEMTAPQRSKYFGEMNESIRDFNDKKSVAPGRAYDAEIENKVRALRNAYGEDIKITRGEGDYYYAQPNTFPGSKKTVGQVRRELKAKGYSDDEINAVFDEAGVEP